MDLNYELFDNFNQFFNSLERPNNGLGESSHFSGYCDWYGTASFDEAVTIMKSGYNEPLKRIKAGHIDNVLAGSIKTYRRELHYYGSSICMGLALQGVPKSFYKRQKRTVQAPVMSLFIDVGVTSSVSVRKKEEYGIKVLNFINDLNNNGYAVNLYVGALTCKGAAGTNFSACLIKIKDATEPLNLLSLCFPIVHPSFMRRLLFAWRETSPVWNYGGYGCSAYNYNYNECSKMIKQALGDEYIYINFSNIPKI